MEGNMKRLATNSLVVIAALALAPAAWALNGGEGLGGTPHDFTSTGTGDLHDPTAGNEGLCTFCHTPHKAQTTLLLWNHQMSGSTFTWDVTATTAGTPLPTNLNGAYGGVSTKCLSCHDGTVAVGDIAWYKEQPWVMGGSGPMGNVGPITSALGGQASNLSLGSPGEFLIANGAGAGNMAGNHPIGIPFPFGAVANVYNNITSGAEAKTLATDWQPNPLLSAVANIRLFHNQPGSSTYSAIQSTYTGTDVGIECSSCHDPHNKQSVDDLFLRGKIAGSAQSDGYICEQCHKKGTP
jgi:hypothetical protein